MVNQLKLAKSFLLLVTPIVTSSAIAPLVLSIAVSPSLAATLASSEARFNIDNFSHNPLEIQSLTEAKNLVTVTSGEVTAEADAFVTFIVNPSPRATSVDNSSYSRVKGDGSNYLGLANSLAEVIGYNFLVGDGEIFSFDFKGFLNLETSIDAPQTENASAAGTLSLELYNSTNSINRDNWILLDYFTLSGALTTPGSGDFLISNNSASISLNDQSRTSFGETEEFAKASVQGDFSRTFDSSTSLTLVETKRNQASVAVSAVPEPSSTLATLGLCLAGLGYRFRSKVFGAKTKITY